MYFLHFVFRWLGSEIFLFPFSGMILHVFGRIAFVRLDGDIEIWMAPVLCETKHRNRTGLYSFLLNHGLSIIVVVFHVENSAQVASLMKVSPLVSIIAAPLGKLRNGNIKRGERVGKTCLSFWRIQLEWFIVVNCKTNITMERKILKC